MVKFTASGSKAKVEDDNESNGSPSSEQNPPNSTSKRKSEDAEGSKKRKRKRVRANGQSHSSRRLSVSKPARDPRDEASAPPTPATERSPSPVIDFDGLSRPSKTPRFPSRKCIS